MSDQEQNQEPIQDRDEPLFTYPLEKQIQMAVEYAQENPTNWLEVDPEDWLEDSLPYLLATAARKGPITPDIVAAAIKKSEAMWAAKDAQADAEAEGTQEETG